MLNTQKPRVVVFTLGGAIVMPQTRGSVDNPSTHGIHIATECLNATNKCLSTRDSYISENGHIMPINPYSPKYNQLYYNSFKS